ncbi:MAG: DUF938 domain-containing protein [Alkalilacustris sp.]
MSDPDPRPDAAALPGGDPLADPAATAARHPGLRHAPATARNRTPIRTALQALLPAGPCTVLEVASGTGEHGPWMLRALPAVTWQPTEASDEGCAAIARWRALCPDLHDRLRPPLRLDAGRPPWPGPPVEAVFCANLTHIAPWPVTLGLMAGAAGRLRPGGLLLIYGPFNEGGRFTGPGNAAFDADLRARDPAWGLRDRAEVDAAARAEGLTPEQALTMPADNRLLTYRRG